MVQQILDPNGTLQHVILTPEPMLSQHQPPPPPQSHPGVPITPYVSTDFSLFFANSDFFFGHVKQDYQLFPTFERKRVGNTGFRLQRSKKL